MARLSNGVIYEFVENKLIEFDKRDGGYYPSKHDGPAFRETANHFGIDIEVVERIYSSYGKMIAKKE